MKVVLVEGSTPNQLVQALLALPPEYHDAQVADAYHTEPEIVEWSTYADGEVVKTQVIPAVLTIEFGIPG